MRKITALKKTFDNFFCFRAIITFFEIFKFVWLCLKSDVLIFDRLLKHRYEFQIRKYEKQILLHNLNEKSFSKYNVQFEIMRTKCQKFDLTTFNTATLQKKTKTTCQACVDVNVEQTQHLSKFKTFCSLKYFWSCVWCVSIRFRIIQQNKRYRMSRKKYMIFEFIDYDRFCSNRTNFFKSFFKFFFAICSLNCEYQKTRHDQFNDVEFIRNLTFVIIHSHKIEFVLKLKLINDKSCICRYCFNKKEFNK